MEPDRLIYLLEAHNSSTITGEETEELNRWYGNLPNKLPVREKLLLNSPELLNNMLSDLRARIPPPSVPFYRKWYVKLSAAAVFILLTGTAVYFSFIKRINLPKKQVAVETLKDILPGNNNAVLTLADGSEIPLGSASRDTSMQQGSVKLVKFANGHIGYLPLNDDKGEEQPVYNTVSTPLGSQYRLTLPDGTIAWLNAASAINYPTFFSGSERVVSITGEVYFEVAPYSANGNRNLPFKVSVKGLEIDVLGTKFNVKAYDNGPFLKTTLAEGAIKISRGGATALLKPGNQARLNSSNQLSVIPEIDLEQELAWMKGMQIFNKDNIKDIMRNVARWYDIEVAYEGNMDDEFFTGKIQYKEPLSSVIKKLQLTNSIRFRLDGNKLTISK